MSHFDSAQYRSMTRTNVMPPPSEPKPPARMARLKELIAAGHQPSAAMAISEREDKHRSKLPEIVRQKPPAGGSTVRKAIIAVLRRSVGASVALFARHLGQPHRIDSAAFALAGAAPGLADGFGWFVYHRVHAQTPKISRYSAVMVSCKRRSALEHSEPIEEVRTMSHCGQYYDSIVKIKPEQIATSRGSI